MGGGLQTHLDRVALHPALLRRIRHAALPWKAHERVGALREVVHLAEERHEKRRLARAGRTDDEVDLAAAEEDLVVHAEYERAAAGAPGSGRSALRRVRGPGEGGVPDTDAVLVRLGDGRGKEGLLSNRGLGVLVNELGLEIRCQR